MDISTVVVVLILIVLFLGGAIWMEIHSRKTPQNESHPDAKNSEFSEMEIAAQYSPFPTLRRHEAAAKKARTKETKL
jgi:flagellar basal body-associated protein FliL